MSDDAVKYAASVPVKGSAMELLKVIAGLIPPGETMTPPISIPELTGLMRGYGQAAARRARYRLVKRGIVRTVAGRGRQGTCYELVGLAGARGPHPPLPLIGEAAPPRGSRPRIPEGPTLFDQPSTDEAAAHGSPVPFVQSTVISTVRKVQSSAARLLKNLKNWLSTVPFVQSTDRRSDHAAKDRVQKVQSNLDRAPDAYRDRTRDVLQLDHVQVQPRADAPTTAPLASRPPPEFHPWHAWCDGRVHVPKKLHADFVQRLGRLAGETDADLEARAFACYAAELATIPADQPIPILNEFEFWRPRFAGMLGAAAPARCDPTIARVAGEDVWSDVLRKIEQSADVNRHTFVTWLLPTSLVEDRGAVIVIAGPAAYDDLFVDYVEKHYGDVVRQAVEAVRPGARVEFRRQSQRTG